MNCQICKYACEDATCPKCVLRAARNLTDIIEFREKAELVPGKSGVTRSTEQPLGVRIGALDAIGAFEYVTVLESWERDWRGFFDLVPYGVASAARNRGSAAHHALPGIVGFLRQWNQRAAVEHPAYREFFHEVTGLRQHAKDAANLRSPVAWRVTCPTDTADGECGRVLMVSGEDFGGEVTCRVCGTVWPVERLLHVVASSRLSELWLDPEAAAQYCGVSARSLRKWSQRGLIRRERGRYEVHSIRKAVADEG